MNDADTALALVALFVIIFTVSFGLIWIYMVVRDWMKRRKQRQEREP